SETGGGICLVNDSYLYANRVTLYGNTAGIEGGGLYSDASSLYMKNSILWENSPDQIVDNSTRLFLVTYSDIMGGYSGTGNIDIDPLFVNADNGNLRLSWENYPVHDGTMSPCIDSGDPDSGIESDGSIVDMGGLHFNQYGTYYYPDVASGTWTAAESPYLLENDVTVDSLSTLVIESGASVFATGLYKLEIKGRLLAEGTTREQIRFGAVYPETGWIGLQFIETNDNGLEGSVLNNCHFQHGNWEDDGLDQFGGAILCNEASDLTISNCIFENNTGYGGGAIFLAYSDVSLENILIDNCISDCEGGGIAIYFCDPQLNNVNVQNCYANDPGGGIYLMRSNAVLQDVVIDNNEAIWYGGGIYCYSLSNPSLTNVTVSNNLTQAEYGGGIYCDTYSIPAVMESLTVIGNTSYNKGGGIFLDGTDSISLQNSTINDNFAYYGGGIYAHYADFLTLSDCTVSGNSAYFHGGGFYYFNTSGSQLLSTDILDNTANNSGGGIMATSSSI
ncbi:MAG: right-handed parallel beta-helix repeat-containing protein, partial [Candidatus Cloacimonetes bacterium]|nr:right-handed parallel beta-helix repeat-containing protein [Candidatus Cloacimonadota bacterium]